MVVLERFRSQACRIHGSQVSLILRSRFFSSSSPPDSPPNEPAKRSAVEPPSVQPVSYAAKPKSPSDEQHPEFPADVWLQNRVPPSVDSSASRAFSREDIRYVKSAPSVTPVSYAKKVAPLPEDRAGEEGGQNDDALNLEGRRIQSDSRVVRRVFRAVEEEKPLPFPTFIKVEEKKEEQKIIDLQDALRLVKANARRKFDETVEAHVNLGIDRRRSDLGVSGSVVLPHGSGKVVRVAVFAEGAAAEEARAAGADVVGGDELIQQIKNGSKLNFDKCIATLSMMKRVASISKVLRALTPNAKKGTVTDDVAAAVKEAKQGLIDFKMKESIVHVGLGKVSYKEEALHENIGAFVNALLLAKPAGLKKTSKYAGYVNSFHLCSTMGPGYQVSIQSLSKAADQYSKARPQ